MPKKVSGGGIQSSVVKKVGVRVGPAQTNKISPRGVSQFGYAAGSRMSKSGSYGTESSSLPVKAGTAPQVPMGNAVAASTVCGVGGSRTVHRTGSQDRHGSPVPGNAPQGRDIFSQYPPETTSKASLVHKR